MEGGAVQWIKTDEGAGFSGEEELRGAKVTPVQACELAKLLGVIIE